MDKILDILTGLRSDVDFENEDAIISDGILDSIGITALITALEEEFDIEIGMEYMENANFESIQTIWDMVQEIMEE